jgi:hypothetical protein
MVEAFRPGVFVVKTRRNHFTSRLKRFAKSASLDVRQNPEREAPGFSIQEGGRQDGRAVGEAEVPAPLPRMPAAFSAHPPRKYAMALRASTTKLFMIRGFHKVLFKGNLY